MRYYYSYENKKYNPIRLVLLAMALVSDFVNVFMIISSFFDPKIWLYILSIFVLFLGIRIASLYMIYSIEYCYYNGEFSIIKKYADDRPHELLKIQKKQISKIYKKVEENDCYIKFYSKTCPYDEYVLELTSGEKYVVNLDTTMYVILKGDGFSDIFR